MRELLLADAKIRKENVSAGIYGIYVVIPNRDFSRRGGKNDVRNPRYRAECFSQSPHHHKALMKNLILRFHPQHIPT